MFSVMAVNSSPDAAPFPPSERLYVPVLLVNLGHKRSQLRIRLDPPPCRSDPYSLIGATILLEITLENITASIMTAMRTTITRSSRYPPEAAWPCSDPEPLLQLSPRHRSQDSVVNGLRGEGVRISARSSLSPPVQGLPDLFSLSPWLSMEAAIRPVVKEHGAVARRLRLSCSGVLPSRLSR